VTVKIVPRAAEPQEARLRPARLLAFLAIALLCAFASTACLPIVVKGPPSLEAFVSATFIPAPKHAAFAGAAWPPNAPGPVAWMQYQSGPRASGPGDDHLYTLDQSGRQLTLLRLPNDPTCKATGQQFPMLLPDGRLGYVQFCFGDGPPERTKRLMAYDFHTQAATPLEPYFLDFGAKDYSFRPDMQVGIINDGNGLDERLDWLTPSGQVDAGLPFARAGQPSWSPDGQFIAVDAAPNDFGETGQDRGTLPRNLYLLSRDGKVVRVVLTDVGEVRGAPLWSADGRWLVASIDFPDGETGLWLIGVESGKVFRLLSGTDMFSPVWSPDHQSIAVPIGLAFPGITSPKIGLYILHVGNLDQLAARVAQ
jgi:hypothetical protein